VVWNTTEVPLVDQTLVGEACADIYVKAWLLGQDEPQETDVHYRYIQ
jgi:hypothetical protein